MQKRDLIVVALCFVAALAGANVQPILTGTGKLVFPETSPSATLSASSGTLSVAAGGSNGNILLQPPGTGKVGIQATSLPGQLTIASGLNTVMSPSIYLGAVRNFSGSDPDGVSIVGYATNGTLGTHDFGGIFMGPNPNTANGGAGMFRMYTGGGSATPTAATQFLAASNGQIGGPMFVSLIPEGAGYAGVNKPSPGYAFDVTGDINSTTLYRANGTAGVSGAITVSVSSANAIVSVGCNVGTIQYLDWSSVHQSATFCTSVTVSTGGFLTGATATANNFSGGIRIQ